MKWSTRRRPFLLLGSAIALLVGTGTACAGDDASGARAASPTAREEPAQPDRTIPDPTTIPDRTTIEVTGDGRVTVVPDQAQVELGVGVSGPSAQNVLDQASRHAAALIDRLQALGVARRDIRTAGISLHPVHDRDDPAAETFRATNTLSVVIRDLSRAGDIIDEAAASAGEAITIGGISFVVSDPQPAMAEARDAAIDDATERATVYAQAIGLELGDVLAISERGASAPTPFPRGPVAEDARVPIEPGTTDLSVAVTVTFAAGRS